MVLLRFGILSKRCIHTVPRLPNVAQLRAEGVPKVLSAVGFRTVWDQYQRYLCDQLTLATSGTSLESYLPFHILLNTAKKSYQSNIFNLASGAHNNHLFVENILPTPPNLEPHPSRLFMSRVQESFGCNWEELKLEMVDRAEQDVIGQGWLFLVENSDKEFHILTIQNNGTPYYFPRNQSFDLNSAVTLEEFAELRQMKELVDKAHNSSKEKIEDWTMPLIVVNLWDQAYLHDYGVKNRSLYVKNVLDNLNWSVVNQRLYHEPLN